MSHSYIALRFRPANNAVDLLGHDLDEGVTETLATASHSFVTDSWQDFEVNWDVDSEAVEINIGSTSMTASVGDIQGLSNRTGYYGEGTDSGFYLDELYIDGDDLEEQFIIEPPEVHPDLSRWPLVRRLTQPSRRVKYIEFDPTGEFMFVGCNGGEAFVYQLDAGWGVVATPPLEGNVEHAAYTTSGDHLVVAMGSGRIEILRTSDYQIVHTIPSGDIIGTPNSIHADPRFNQFAFGTDRGYVYIWSTSAADPSNWSRSRVLTNDVDQGNVQDLRWHPDGDYLGYVVGSRARIWESGGWTSGPHYTFTEGTNAYRTIDWHPEGRFILYGGGLDRTLQIRDPTSNFDHVQTLEGATNNIWYARFSSMGRYLAHGEFDTGRIQLYTVEDTDIQHYLTIQETLQHTLDNRETTKSVAWHPNNEYLAYGTREIPAVYAHSSPIRSSVTMSSGAMVNGHLVRHTKKGSATLQSGSAVSANGLLTGPAVWYLEMDHGTVLVDDITPSRLATITPGNVVTLTLLFDNPEDYRERYREVIKYSEVAAAASIRHGLSDMSRPWFRERIQHDDIDSLLIRMIPGAGVDEDFGGWWGLITGMTDQSHGFTSVRAVEINMLILAGHREYETADALRNALQAPVFGGEVF